MISGLSVARWVGLAVLGLLLGPLAAPAFALPERQEGANGVEAATGVVTSSVPEAPQVRAAATRYWQVYSWSNSGGQGHPRGQWVYRGYCNSYDDAARLVAALNNAWRPFCPDFQTKIVPVS